MTTVPMGVTFGSLAVLGPAAITDIAQSAQNLGYQSIWTVEATGSDASRALIAGVAPETVVQKMGQRPYDLDAQMQGCNLLVELIDTDPGKCLGAANARALPVVLRILRHFGHKADVQLCA